MNDVTTQLNEYAFRVAEKAARRAYNEASRVGANQVRSEVERALSTGVEKVTAEAWRQMEKAQAFILEDFYTKALPTGIEQMLVSLQETTQALSAVATVLTRLAKALAVAGPASPSASGPRLVRRRIERDENGRMTALIEEPLE